MKGIKGGYGGGDAGPGIYICKFDSYIAKITYVGGGNVCDHYGALACYSVTGALECGYDWV